MTVMLSSPPRSLASSIRRSGASSIGCLVDDLEDLLVLDQVREPVAAEDERVASLELHAHEVHLDLLLEARPSG